MMITNFVLSIILAGPTPFFHPDKPIFCPSYLPGTNTRVPPGVVYQYSPVEYRAHLLRCYCETVKTIEQMCIRGGYGERRCKQKTTRWIEENLPIAINQNQTQNPQPTPRRNVIINLQVNP